MPGYESEFYTAWVLTFVLFVTIWVFFGLLAALVALVLWFVGVRLAKAGEAMQMREGNS